METAAPTAALDPRQIWSTPTSRVHPPHCTAFDLPANGILVLNGSATVTLRTDAVFQPFCTDIASLDPNGTLPISDFQVPFIASTVPQIFVIGAMLVISWILVVILIITPRTSFVISTGTGFVGRRSILGNPYSRSKVIGVGGRPLLQKVAALTVFISLLIATVNSLNLAAQQYSQGYEDAVSLTTEVVGSLEIRIIRVISETCLWLAQVQTLIRLFPRRKEKIIIMWSGFALILLDTLFSILDDFVADTDDEKIRAPRAFTNVVPALAYLFHLALSLVYACSVVYYSLVKRRFAYFHNKMRNICVVAMLSLMSIAVPVIFFVLDVAKPLLIGWGDYVRWVGAAAASVVVWEWVERIEALEREDRKDGILGREIFDGDEPVESNHSEPHWPGTRRSFKRRRGTSDDNDNNERRTAGGKGATGFASATAAFNVSSLVNRMTHAGRKQGQARAVAQARGQRGGATANGLALSRMQPSAMPANAASPVSRSDTTSAASTVYAVIHHADDATPESDRNLNTLGFRRSTTGTSNSTADPYFAAASQSPSSTLSSRTPSAPRSRNLAQQYLRSHLPRRWGREDGSPSPVTESPMPVSSSPSSSGNSPHPPPPPRAASTSSSRILSRLRRLPAEPTGELPLFVIRGGQVGDDNLVIEPKFSDEEARLRHSPAAVHGDHSGSAAAALSGSESSASATAPPAPGRASGPSPPAQTAPTPYDPRSSRHTPPPPFSAASLSGSGSPSTGTPESAEGRAQNSSNGSRASRRSWGNMPVVQEDERGEHGGVHGQDHAPDGAAGP